MEAQSREPRVYLPDFCAAGTILVVLLVAELVAILLTLAAHTPEGRFLTELAKMSMYVLWLALLSAAVLCQVRQHVQALAPARAFTICFVLVEVLCLVVAEITYRLTDIFGAAAIINDTHGGFLLRSFAISTIILALSLRYLYISSEWRRSIVLEAQARVSALQALIRPHFLFNSMNTIASLTRSNPARAEEAVEDLSELLRVNLGGPRDVTTLKEELEVAAIYQRIEKLRLGDRLRVRWDIGELPLHALIPSLTIQPLLENAIHHGIEMLPDGGEVTIRGERRDDRVSITVSNPVPAESKRKKSGNRMALDNIVQRYELAYGSRASVKAGESDGQFRVQLDFPCEESRT